MAKVISIPDIFIQSIQFIPWTRLLNTEENLDDTSKEVSTCYRHRKRACKHDTGYPQHGAWWEIQNFQHKMCSQLNGGGLWHLVTCFSESLNYRGNVHLCTNTHLDLSRVDIWCYFYDISIYINSINMQPIYMLYDT